MSDSEDHVIHEQKTFTSVNYAGKLLRDREFIKCTFIACDFSKSDLRDNDFVDCHFKDCNFSLTIIEGAGFRNATFIGSKLLGIDFTRCNRFMFSFAFQDCHIDYCTFFGTKLRKTNFINCTLKETDFSEADLSVAVFEKCDLSETRFLNTILEKTDFRTAQNFSIDPEANKMKKSKFDAANLAGLLFKYQLDIE